MNKLSLDALQMRAEAIASDELLATISGGTENACHDGPKAPPVQHIETRDGMICDPCDKARLGR